MAQQIWSQGKAGIQQSVTKCWFSRGGPQRVGKRWTLSMTKSYKRQINVKLLYYRIISSEMLRKDTPLPSGSITFMRYNRPGYKEGQTIPFHDSRFSHIRIQYIFSRGLWVAFFHYSVYMLIKCVDGNQKFVWQKCVLFAATSTCLAD